MEEINSISQKMQKYRLINKIYNHRVHKMAACVIFMRVEVLEMSSYAIWYEIFINILWALFGGFKRIGWVFYVGRSDENGYFYCETRVNYSYAL